MLYSNKYANEIVYKDIFDKAESIGIKTFYTLTDQTQIPNNWAGKVGRIDANMIRQCIPDYSERTFYLSGPQAMVSAYKEILVSMNIPRRQIRTDYFPGF